MKNQVEAKEQMEVASEMNYPREQVALIAKPLTKVLKSQSFKLNQLFEQLSLKQYKVAHYAAICGHLALITATNEELIDNLHGISFLVESPLGKRMKKDLSGLVKEIILLLALQKNRHVYYQAIKSLGNIAAAGKFSRIAIQYLLDEGLERLVEFIKTVKCQALKRNIYHALRNFIISNSKLLDKLIQLGLFEILSEINNKQPQQKRQQIKHAISYLLMLLPRDKNIKKMESCFILYNMQQNKWNNLPQLIVTMLLWIVYKYRQIQTSNQYQIIIKAFISINNGFVSYDQVDKLLSCIFRSLKKIKQRPDTPQQIKKIITKQLFIGLFTKGKNVINCPKCITQFLKRDKSFNYDLLLEIIKGQIVYLNWTIYSAALQCFDMISTGQRRQIGLQYLAWVYKHFVRSEINQRQRILKTSQNLPGCRLLRNLKDNINLISQIKHSQNIKQGKLALNLIQVYTSLAQRDGNQQLTLFNGNIETE